MSAPVRTAVILAAGRGTRLGEAGAEIPKGFIQLGAHAIVEESIVRLRHAGIERIIIVTGHQQQWYEAMVDRLGSFVRTVTPDLMTEPKSVSRFRNSSPWGAFSW